MHRGLLGAVLAGTSPPGHAPCQCCVWFTWPPRPASLVSASVVPGPGAASPARPGLVTPARCRCCLQSHGERDHERRALVRHQLRQTLPTPL